MEQNERPAILPEGEGIHCPSCGKYVGGYERCPHCQAAVPKRLPIIYIKRFAIFGTIIGLILMWFAAVNKQVPVIRIGSIKIENNMALVRVVGRITSVRINEDRNSFQMKLDDDSGTMAIAGFDKYKKFKAHFADQFPAEGDQVEVTGNLSISEKHGESMFVSDPRRVKILKKFEPEPIKIEDIETDDRGTVYRLRVKVAATRRYKIGTNVTVKDDTGSMDLNLFDSDAERIPDAKMRDRLLIPGNEFELVALVDAFRGKVQLKLHHPDRPESLRFIAGPPLEEKKEAPELKAAEVRKERMNEVVIVTGRVERIKEFGFATSFFLADESGAVQIWFKDPFRKAAPAGLVAEGAMLRVTGQVSEFKGDLQVQPRSEADVVAAGQPAPSPAPAPAPSPAPAPAGGE